MTFNDQNQINFIIYICLNEQFCLVCLVNCKIIGFRQSDASNFSQNQNCTIFSSVTCLNMFSFAIDIIMPSPAILTDVSVDKFITFRIFRATPGISVC